MREIAMMAVSKRFQGELTKAQNQNDDMFHMSCGASDRGQKRKAARGEESEEEDLDGEDGGKDSVE